MHCCFAAPLTHFPFKLSSPRVWAIFVAFLMCWQKWNSKRHRNTHTGSEVTVHTMKNGWGGCSRHQTSALLKDIAAKITPRQRWSHIQCYFLSGIHLKCLWWKQNVSSKCHTFDLETKSNVVWYQLKGQKKATLATKRSFILYTTCIHLHDIWFPKRAITRTVQWKEQNINDILILHSRDFKLKCCIVLLQRKPP